MFIEVTRSDKKKISIAKSTITFFCTRTPTIAFPGNCYIEVWQGNKKKSYTVLESYEEVYKLIG